MIEHWLMEAVKGIGRFFLNPLVYWSILLVIFSGYKRIKEERLDFGSKVFDVFSEWKGTHWIAIISGIIVSVITLGTGMVLNYETIIILSIITILLSITISFTMLSPIYTIGITYLLFLFLPYVWKDTELFGISFTLETNFTVLSILLGLFLVVEAVLVKSMKRNRTYPSISLSRRGIWVGQHRLKRMAVIPFFMLIPTGNIVPIAPYWPVVTFGDESFGIVLIPFIIGFDYIAKGHMPKQAAGKLSKYIMLLGLAIIAIAVGGIFIHWLSFVALIVAILGKEYIHYRYRYGDKVRLPYFHPENDGLKIVSIIPGTPADRSGLLVGEIIAKVNGVRVNNVHQFYLALQNSGAYFKLDVLDDNKEIRFVQGAYYEGEHHELGLLFSEKPHKKKMKKVN
ncbi:PDZ domain-containing protein [Oceanobacillus sp. Castelsardo]|uniref:PDZ domain-containing protein n=1 Tax=Oceanobacillus sp. Castelsardo TaxID=1851204 RepID=UPI00083889A8|nr:PDZ domain-containing protein [Oceanobacillus sp. Castelsardo]